MSDFLCRVFGSVLLASVLLLQAGTVAAQTASQEGLPFLINPTPQRTMAYDWPILKVASGEYPDGPTGVTVFHFDKKVSVAIDARGGGPGTVNAPYIELGYDSPELDTVVFAGGSWYGLEATTAVASALKDDGIRDGDAFSTEANIAMSVGAIIFDFGARRLNEIYPDKRLAQATFRAAESGSFALGAQGAGRFAKTGGFFGCDAFSGQGGAFRQMGDIKIAAFTVVNALGAVNDREGRTVACYGGPDWPQDLRTADMLADLPKSRQQHWAGPGLGKPSKKNTTVSLIVTNQRLTPAYLQRLAVQVHTSMARAIQPFATVFDGDVLYAVSTNELEGDGMPLADLGAVASEVMWDAILSSVPVQPESAIVAERSFHSDRLLQALTGEYRFSATASLNITAKGEKLFAQASGGRDVYAIGRDEPVELLPVSATDFTVPGRYPLVLRFSADGDLLVNPGHWQQLGTRN